MSRLGQEAGASSVELIIFFPLLLLVVLITVQVALTWYGNEVAIATAREVAREARANSKGGDLSAAKSNGAAYARKVGGKALTDVEIDVSTTSDQVTVRVSGKSLDVVAGLSPRVKASVTSERETFRSDR